MAAVFDAVFDITDMKQRVDATGSKLSAAAQDERERNAHLLQVLEAVENTLTHDHQHMRRLEQEQGRTLEEFQQLRKLLHDMQIGPRHLLWRRLHRKSFAARADLIDRLDAIISMMNPDGEEAADGDNAKEPAAALARKRPSMVLAFFSFIGSLIAVALVAYKVNSSMPFHLVKRNKMTPREGRLYGRGV